MDAEDLLNLVGIDRAEIHTIALGIIEEYNPETERADVSLKAKRAYDGEEFEREPIPDVPVLQPSAGQWDIRLPLYGRKAAEEACREPDNVLLLFLEHPHEGMLDDDKPSMPLAGDVIDHSEENAVALPMRPFIPDEDKGIDQRSGHHAAKDTMEDHAFRLYNRHFHQEIVLMDAPRDGRIILNVDKESEKFSPTAKIDLVEDAQYHVLQAEPAKQKYNVHTHTGSLGPGVDGPPMEPFKWKPRLDWSLTVRVDTADTAPPSAQHDPLCPGQGGGSRP